MEEKKELRKVLQVRKLGSVIAIFLGLIGMQMAAYILYVLGVFLRSFWKQGDFVAALDTIARSGDDGLGNINIWLSVISACLCLVWCGALYRRSFWRQKPFSYRKAFGGKRIPGIVSVAFGSCVLLTLLVSVLASLIPSAFTGYNQVMDQLDYRSSTITSVYVLLIGPVSEEIIFRGAMMDRLKLAFPFWTANIIQAAFFGLYHMNFIQGVYAFCLGIILGLILEVTGTILGNIAAHVIFNGTSMLLGLFSGGDGILGVLQWIFLMVTGITALVWGISYFLRGCSFCTGNSQ